jgi:glycosyltransferase involved in cell wall biosynthesis
MPGAPLISIITVTYNAVDSIETTIKSVIEHKNSNCEFIIIDGGSVDGTVEVIKKYQEQITHWISEPDNGIYDAMNKGIRLATGTYLYFINCGDTVIKLPFDILQEYAGFAYKLLAFPVMDSTNRLRIPAWNPLIKIKNLLPHQGCFYKRDLNIEYNLSFKVFADLDLNQKLYIQKNQVLIFDNPAVAIHDLNGISHDKKYGKEVFSVVESNFGFVFKSISFIYFKFNGLNVRLKNIYKSRT